MNKELVKLFYIMYHISLDFKLPQPPVEFCDDINKLSNLINNNKQYKIMLACPVRLVSELYDVIKGRYVYEAIVIGDHVDPEKTNGKLKVLKTNDDLAFDILHTTIKYANDEECLQRKLGNHGLVDALRQYECHLLDQIKDFA